MGGTNDQGAGVITNEEEGAQEETDVEEARVTGRPSSSESASSNEEGNEEEEGIVAPPPASVSFPSTRDTAPDDHPTTKEDDEDEVFDLMKVIEARASEAVVDRQIRTKDETGPDVPDVDDSEVVTAVTPASTKTMRPAAVVATAAAVSSSPLLPKESLVPSSSMDEMEASKVASGVLQYPSTNGNNDNNLSPIRVTLGIAGAETVMNKEKQEDKDNKRTPTPSTSETVDDSSLLLPAVGVAESTTSGPRDSGDPSLPGAFALATTPTATIGDPLATMDDSRESAMTDPFPSLMRNLQTEERQLSEALAVDDESEGEIVSAVEMDPETLQRRAKRQRQDQTWQRICAAAGLLSLLLFILVLVFSLREKNDDADTALLQDVTSVPSGEVSTALSNSPSSAPTSVLDSLLDVLPGITLESLNNYSSPQSQAYNWLMHHANITHLDDWRKTQLFALGTFYYSFDNEKWKDHIRGEWLDVTRHECNWFTSQQGTYKNGTFVYTTCPPNVTSCVAASGFTSGILPCDKQGQFKSLILSTLLPKETPNTVTLPFELTLLPHLRRLGLNNNRISASLEDFGVHHLTQLEGFQIQKNQLTGTFPTELGQMTNLKIGRVSFNKLSGVLPSQVGMMSRLEFFDIASNDLSGTIPNQVWTMDSLKSFYAFGNDFTGTISTDIAQLSDTFLRLNLANQFNGLTGTIPSEVALLSSLLLLDLGNNQFSGPLPTDLGRLKNLTKLSLGENRLTGQIPSEVGFLTNLKELLLNGNGFNGVVPTELGLLTKLESLQLSNSSFIGEIMIPSQLALLTNLVDYDFEMLEVNATLVVP